MLQFTEPHTISHDDCVDDFSLLPNLPLAKMVRDTMVCTTNAEGVGACQGDSGTVLKTVNNASSFCILYESFDYDRLFSNRWSISRYD